MLTLSALTGPSGMGGGSKSAYPAERPEEHIGRSSPLKGFHWTVKDSFKLPISFKSIASSCFSDTKRSFVSHFLEFWLFLDFEVQWSWKGHWKVMERSLKSHWKVKIRHFPEQILRQQLYQFFCLRKLEWQWPLQWAVWMLL